MVYIVVASSAMAASVTPSGAPDTFFVTVTVSEAGLGDNEKRRHVCIQILVVP